MTSEPLSYISIKSSHVLNGRHVFLCQRTLSLPSTPVQEVLQEFLQEPVTGVLALPPALGMLERGLMSPGALQVRAGDTLTPLIETASPAPVRLINRLLTWAGKTPTVGGTPRPVPPGPRWPLGTPWP